MCFFWPGRYITVEIFIRKSHFIKLCAHQVKHPFPLAEDHDLIALFFQKLPDEAHDFMDLVPMICFFIQYIGRIRNHAHAVQVYEQSLPVLFVKETLLLIQGHVPGFPGIEHPLFAF
jgi:hypothetical protein